MELISHYRLRKLASADRSTAFGELGAQIAGAGLTGATLGGVGSLVGGLGTYAVADLINRIRFRKKGLYKDLFRQLANRKAAVVGAGIGGLTGTGIGLYAGSRLGKDLYGAATNKYIDHSEKDMERIIRRDLAKAHLAKSIYDKYK